MTAIRGNKRRERPATKQKDINNRLIERGARQDYWRHVFHHQREKSDNQSYVIVANFLPSIRFRIRVDEATLF